MQSIRHRNKYQVWIGGSGKRVGGGLQGTSHPSLAQNLFIFMQFSERIGQIVGYPPLGEKGWIGHWFAVSDCECLLQLTAALPVTSSSGRVRRQAVRFSREISWLGTKRTFLTRNRRTLVCVITPTTPVKTLLLTVFLVFCVLLKQQNCACTCSKQSLELLK